MKFAYKDKLTYSKKIVITAFLISIGTVLQICENLFNVFSIPGGKLGIANIVVLVDFFLIGSKNALIVASMRAVMGCLLFGGVSAFPYSFFGALCSTAVMIVAKNFFTRKLSIVGISIIGGVIHNLTQLTVASIIFGSFAIYTYMPVLTIIGAIGGMLTGYATKIFCEKTGLIEL